VTLALAIGCGLAAAKSHGQTTLRGRVVDARTALPLAEVAIVVTAGRDTVGRARSDSAGEFEAPIATAASIVAHFVHIGFRPHSIAATIGDIPLRVAMVPARSPTNLAAMVVRDTAISGFEKRARRNAGGVFLRLADIEKAKAVRTSDLFRSMPGVSVQLDSAGLLRVFSQRTARPALPKSRATVTSQGDTIVAPASDARRCAIRIGVDGRLMPPDFTVDDLRPSDIAAIEAYVGAATVPVEFSSVQRDAPCGILMLWTRTGAER